MHLFDAPHPRVSEQLALRLGNRHLVEARDYKSFTGLGLNAGRADKSNMARGLSPLGELTEDVGKYQLRTEKSADVEKDNIEGAELRKDVVNRAWSVVQPLYPRGSISEESAYSPGEVSRRSPSSIRWCRAIASPSTRSWNSAGSSR